MTRPVFWLIAGPNGAGKSTIATSPHRPLQRLIRGLRIINPDERARRILINEHGRRGFSDSPLALQKTVFIRAAEEVERLLDSKISCGARIGIETVLSTEKFKPFVERVCKMGGVFGIIYIALRSHEIAFERVAHRVSQGGHDVPKAKIESRWKRSLENLPWFISRARFAFVFDNSGDLFLPPTLIAHKDGERFVANLDEAFPELRKALRAAL